MPIQIKKRGVLAKMPYLPPEHVYFINLVGKLVCNANSDKPLTDGVTGAHNTKEGRAIPTRSKEAELSDSCLLPPQACKPYRHRM